MHRSSLLAALAVVLLAPAGARATPRTVVISLDGATPRLVDDLLARGVLPRDEGLGLLRRHGAVAARNTVIAPSLTAASHVAMATGASAARNDVVSNTFHLLASPFAPTLSTVSGFGAPIGGYDLAPLGESAHPTARPLWVTLQAAGKSVVTATWPGGDGVDVKVPGLAASPVIQSASTRTVSYTVPFGEFGGLSARGFALDRSAFAPAAATTLSGLAAAGKKSFSPVLETALETATVSGVTYHLRAAALDTTDDGQVNYDTLVFFDDRGIGPGPFALPSTGPAYVRAADRRSSPFFLEGSPKKALTAFYVTQLAPDLSTVHLARYAASDLPRNAPVLAAVDDVNAHVGAWAAQADYRIPERLAAGFSAFSDEELEALYEDQVKTFVDYQTRVALRAIEVNPDADLVMVYIEQPDGSEHQYLLTDPRQPTSPTDPSTIGAGQDAAKVARYGRHVETAYRVANRGVQRILEAVGLDPGGRPRADVFAVSDHGFDPFHTSVNVNALLAGAGIPSTQARAVTSGPAVNVYIDLDDRPRGHVGTVRLADFATLQATVVAALRGLVDDNPEYAPAGGAQVFDVIATRPAPASPSDPPAVTPLIGQDSGDVFAMLRTGYNFDGAQSPPVVRQGDPAPAVGAAPVLSVPNFYGAHGYDPGLPHMSAIFYAAGPHIRRARVEAMHSVDLAPTVEHLLGVAPDPTVEGRVLREILREGERDRDDDRSDVAR